ncbi:MAG TPA: helix-turn-helix domain-containing protein [Thermoleophilaceae bacterium]|nr:helix-turn-helix domain-containing protein [Thermoleophilaceae bacterium]
MPRKSYDTTQLAPALRALGHPVPLRLMLDAQQGVELSASKAQERMPDVSLGTVAYHVRRLAAAGLLRATGHVPRRGAVEHLYVLSPLGVELSAILEQLRGQRPSGARRRQSR